MRPMGQLANSFRYDPKYMKQLYDALMESIGIKPTETNFLYNIEHINHIISGWYKSEPCIRNLTDDNYKGERARFFRERYFNKTGL